MNTDQFNESKATLYNSSFRLICSINVLECTRVFSLVERNNRIKNVRPFIITSPISSIFPLNLVKCRIVYPWHFA